MSVDETSFPSEATWKPSREAFQSAAHRLVHKRAAVAVIALWLMLIALVVCSRFIQPSYGSIGFTWTLITIASFTVVASFGQGIVVLSGGIDLSIPNVLTLGGVLLSQWSGGSNHKAAYVVPLVLAVGAGIGALNGLGVTLLRLSPVVMTLATNVILGGVILVATSGTPKGAPPPEIQSIMERRVWGSLPLIDVLTLGFVVVAVATLHRTAFGRRVYAVGTNRTAAYFSGVAVNRVVIVVYALSGLCAALVGIMLAGYAQQAYLSMGEPYLLLTLAAVVVGGAAITGGSGYYLGTVAAALLLTTVTTLLQGTTLPDAARQMVYAGAIIAAVVAARASRASRAAT